MFKAIHFDKLIANNNNSTEFFIISVDSVWFNLNNFFNLYRFFLYTCWESLTMITDIDRWIERLDMIFHCNFFFLLKTLNAEILKWFSIVFFYWLRWLKSIIKMAELRQFWHFICYAQESLKEKKKSSMMLLLPQLTCTQINCMQFSFPRIFYFCWRKINMRSVLSLFRTEKKNQIALQFNCTKKMWIFFFI